jgi:hypothetical protein
MRKYAFILLFCIAVCPAFAQVGSETYGYNSINEEGTITRQGDNRNSGDTHGDNKEIPKGLYTWTVDRRFGDRTAAVPDTLSHMYMNSIFTEGLRGEYNTTGNLGAPRQARIFIDRSAISRNFLFINPYSFFITPAENFQFTNTLSPFTNLSYNNCGDRTNGEDHLTARFAVNAGKKIGAGFLFDYLYGRGYYSAQSTAHFNYTMYGSYLGDRYQAHFLGTTNHQKVTENGGITNDNYITHPEIFNETFQTSEIPTMLSSNWNRNDNQRLFFTQRYIVGYNRKVPMTAQEIAAKKFAMASQKEAEAAKSKEEAMQQARKAGRDANDDDLTVPQTFSGRPDGAKIAEGPAKIVTPADSAGGDTRIRVDSKQAADSLIAAAKKAAEDTSWTKNEYVPVTSFIHTAEFNNYNRIYTAYATPENYYLDAFTVKERFGNDSIYDQTKHWNLRNTFAISLLEGFNKWAKAGVKVFAAHELNHYSLPDSGGVRSWNENALSVGGQIAKTQGKTLHYNVTGEFGVGGINLGELHVDGGVDLNFPLFKDTMTLAATGYYRHERPAFYHRHYQSRHFWWDNQDLSFTDHLHVQGILNYQKTRTRIRVAYDIITNYTYLSTTYTVTDEARLYNTVGVKQSGGAINVLTAEVAQDLTFGPLNWESVVTFQKSTNDDALPLPAINAYTNLYLRFKIARVLKTDFGVDARYFTGYHAPDYVPALGMYAVQGNDSKTTIGNYPIVNVYANFHLKHTRFFIMMSHVNAGVGKKNYFLAPHYPLNGNVLRMGLSWNFYN